MLTLLARSGWWKCIGALVLLAVPVGQPASAQTAPTTRHPHLPLGCEVETAPPYSSWKTHRGKPEECLAVVRYGDKTCNALVVRCDGFLAVPESAWQAQLDKQKLDVVVFNAEAESEVGPFPITTALRRKTARADYRLVKLNEHHVRSLPLLASHQLTQETPLLVLWAQVDPASKKIVVERRRARCRNVPEGRKDFHASLSYEGEAPRSVPSGAVVVDEASGAGVGMITEGSQPTQFSTWRYWYEMINEVGLAPDRDAVQNKVPSEKSRMVRVPGGPVRILDRQCGNFVSTYGTDIVCTADFYCDINPVTNGEWITWRESLGNKPPLPPTWESVKNPPHNNPLIPVCGLRVQDMEDYAAVHGKRMITEVEFLRASYTKDMSWLDRIDQSVAQIQANLLPLLKEYTYQIQQRTEGIKLQAQLQQQSNNRIQQIDVSDITTKFRANVGAVWQQVLSQGLVQNSTQTIPGHVHSVQFVPEDKSDVGVRQIHLNAPEACQSYAQNYIPAAKTRPSRWDPFLSPIRLSSLARGERAPTVLLGPLISMSFDPLMNLMLWAGQWENQVGVGMSHTALGTDYLVVEGIDFLGIGRSALAFRCVR